MTSDEFEAEYAARSRITVERLREMGRIVAPCGCEEGGCEGWQSTTLERLRDYAELRGMKVEQTRTARAFLVYTE